MERGWSQEKVARQAHLSGSVIQHLEHFRRSLSYRVAVLVSSAFVDTAPDFGQKSRRGLNCPPGADGGQAAAVPVRVFTRQLARCAAPGGVEASAP